MSNIERQGLGYSYCFSNGVTFTVNRIRVSREGIIAEITASSQDGSIQPFIHWARVNITDSWSRERYITACRRRSLGLEADWHEMIEILCHEVVSSERASSSFILVGGSDKVIADEWLIENFLYKGEPTVLFGDGGTGKSRFCLANMLSVQTGKEFVPGMKPKITGPVLYLDWEAHPHRLNTRIATLCAGIGIDPVKIRYKRCTESLQNQVEEVSEYCNEHGIVALIIDSVEMAMSGTKDSGADANDSAVKLYAALRVIGIASLLLDHVTKGDTENPGPRNEYGSIFKRNLARMQFELRLSEEDGGDNCFQIALHHKKRNDDGKLNDSVVYKVFFDQDTTLYTIDGFHGSDLITGLKTVQGVKQVLIDSTTRLSPIEIQRITGKKKSAVMMSLTRGLTRGIYDCVKGTYGIAGRVYD